LTIIKRRSGYGVRVWDRVRRRKRWVGTYRTLKEARQAEANATLRPTRGKPVTVGDWANMWLSDYARPAASTQLTYRYAAQQISEELGGLLLGEIDRPMARKLAKTWPRGTMRVSRTMFGDAMRDGLIDFNPFSELRLETPKGRKDLDALTESEIHRLADIAARVHDDYGEEARAIVLTLAYVGLRPGELCALRRNDLDVDARELTIRYSLDGSGREKAPKNGKPRVVTVPPPALDGMSQVSARPGSSYLFHTPRGHRFSKGSLAYVWRPIGVAWSEQDDRRITPYHLRHACATLLLERGLTPADAATQLGHQDGGRLVQTLYGHPDEARARERLKMAFGSEGSPRSGRTVAGGGAEC